MIFFQDGFENIALCCNFFCLRHYRTIGMSSEENDRYLVLFPDQSGCLNPIQDTIKGDVHEDKDGLRRYHKELQNLFTSNLPPKT